jgi:hypothetical protein
VEILLDRILRGRSPSQTRIIDPLTKVEPGNVQEYAKNWEKWLGGGTR